MVEFRKSKNRTTKKDIVIIKNIGHNWWGWVWGLQGLLLDLLCTITMLSLQKVISEGGCSSTAFPYWCFAQTEIGLSHVQKEFQLMQTTKEGNDIGLQPPPLLNLCSVSKTSVYKISKDRALYAQTHFCKMCSMLLSSTTIFLNGRQYWYHLLGHSLCRGQSPACTLASFQLINTAQPFLWITLIGRGPDMRVHWAPGSDQGFVIEQHLTAH